MANAYYDIYKTNNIQFFLGIGLGVDRITPTMHKNLILPVDLKTVYPS